MPRYQFGEAEALHCIRDVKLEGPEKQELCLAYKTTTFSFFAPVYMRDDGYVLAVKSRNDTYYDLPPGERLAALQANGSLPSPLPAYSIPLSSYLFGHLVSIVILVMVAFSAAQYLLKRRRRASLETLLPPGQTPLRVESEADRWLFGEVGKHLLAGETIEQQAYGYDHEDANAVTSAYYVALTNQRLIVVSSRVGAFRPVLESGAVITHDRKTIESVHGDERHVHFVFAEAPPFDFFGEWSERHLSNQRRFLADVPRLFPSAAKSPEAALEPGSA